MFVYTKEGWKPLLFGIDSSDFGLPDKPFVPGLTSGDNFGVSTALGNEFAVAGAFADDVDSKVDQGSVTVFKKESGKWAFYTKITASDGQAGDNFGRSVAISGDLIFVGSPMNNSLENNDEGAVYVYKIVDGTIQFQQLKEEAEFRFEHEKAKKDFDSAAIKGYMKYGNDSFFIKPFFVPFRPPFL